MNPLSNLVMEQHRIASAALSRAERALAMYQNDEERINDLPSQHLTGKRLNIVDLTPYEFTSFRTVDGKFEFYEAPF